MSIAILRQKVLFFHNANSCNFWTDEFPSLISYIQRLPLQKSYAECQSTANLKKLIINSLDKWAECQY